MIVNESNMEKEYNFPLVNNRAIDDYIFDYIHR
jgi:hypothetical protein